MVRATIGVVSDTHGLFDPKLRELFAGVNRILHAGDVCGEAVLEELGRLAPVDAICGNCDARYPTSRLPAWRLEEISGLRILVVHDLKASAARVHALRPDVVISGHSHHGRAVVDGETLYLNPGSPGKRRFKLIRSAALLLLGDDAIEARIFSIEGERPEEINRARLARVQDHGERSTGRQAAG